MLNILIIVASDFLVQQFIHKINKVIINVRGDACPGSGVSIQWTKDDFLEILF